MSQRQVAKQMGMDPSGLNLRLRTGKPELALTEVETLAKILQVGPDEVLRHVGLALDGHARPGKVLIAGWADAEFRIHKAKGREWVDAPRDTPAGTTAIRCQTASTRADSYDGRLMYYIPATGVPASAIGRLCVVVLPSGESWLRVVRQGYARGTYNLIDDAGGPLKENVMVDSASPVLWVRM
jgi:hypothetical protein